MLQIIILGSAAGGGFPQWNCNCEACRDARAGRATPRTQSSIAVSANGKHWFLCNASPDLRQQINATPRLHPGQGPRHSPLAGVILTNADVDHVAGLLTLRESTPLVLYATQRVLDTLRSNRIFNALNPDLVERRAFILDEPFEPVTPGGEASGLRIEPFAVPGKVALYLEDPAAGANFGTRVEDTVGLRITSLASGSTFFYIPGCAELTADLAARLRRAPLVLFDGTLWYDDEMIDAGLGVKSGARMGHMSMSGPHGSMAAFRDLGVARKVYVHINNSNPALLKDTPQRREARAAGWEIAHDGMEMTL